ncbi:MAG: hypothetical protein U9N42_08700 [Campylobacterota bacterium]|nr:hypothetical protein [Campylobacterota bacterium]
MPTQKVTKTSDGVKIDFTSNVNADTLKTMVFNCQNGKCDCMSDETKSKIEGMSIDESEGQLTLNIQSEELETKDIKEALGKSTIINKS